MGIRELAEQLMGLLQFGIVDDGVDSHIDTGTKTMGVLAQLSDIVDGIAGSSTGTKLHGTYIHSVGTMVDSRDAALKILGGCQ